ncbi:MAG: hypothetical protein JSV37_09315 [Anaerolineaceae bacterium]|nr:MAG: hypothetical protein JSV37_09315 [Anaerolineaceae bacterium]
MLDMYRQLDKLLAACGRLIPIALQTMEGQGLSQVASGRAKEFILQQIKHLAGQEISCRRVIQIKVSVKLDRRLGCFFNIVKHLPVRDAGIFNDTASCNEKLFH